MSLVWMNQRKYIFWQLFLECDSASVSSGGGMEMHHLLHHDRWISSWPSINYPIVLPSSATLIVQLFLNCQFRWFPISNICTPTPIFISFASKLCHMCVSCKLMTINTEMLDTKHTNTQKWAASENFASHWKDWTAAGWCSFLLIRQICIEWNAKRQSSKCNRVQSAAAQINATQINGEEDAVYRKNSMGPTGYNC